MKAPASLQGRLLALVLGAVVAAWLAAAQLTYLDTRHELDELLDAHLAQGAALLIAQQVPTGDDEDHGEHGEADAPALHRYAPRVAFQVWHEGRLVRRSANVPVAPMSPETRGFATLPLGDELWRVFGARGAEHDVQVFVGERIGSRESILRAVMRGMLGPMLATLPVLALALWWAVRRGLLPLRRLRQAVAEREPRSLQPIALDAAPAEIEPVVQALNQLFERIAALLDSERRFTADAAHELRTPIAAIRAQAQVALGSADEVSRRHALRSTLDGCDRAVHLVEQLLTLSRLEAAPGDDSAPVDLAALTRQVAADLAPRALDKRQTLELDADTPCAVRGAGALVGVLLRNLLDNAIRYSPAGATVRASVQLKDGAATLEVHDSGPGLDETQRARLGERFFRVLGSEQSGSGLGWSIVQRIAAAQGAKVETGRSAALGGLAVTVTWPAHHRRMRGSPKNASNSVW
jgi:two-component system, OmpR family, sensor histidine kinase QseC